jgi:hypothetical protein
MSLPFGLLANWSTIGPATGKLTLQPNPAHYMPHRPEEPTLFCPRSHLVSREGKSEPNSPSPPATWSTKSAQSAKSAIAFEIPG